MTLTSEALRLNTFSKEIPQQYSLTTEIRDTSKKIAPRHGTIPCSRKETPDVVLSKSATTGCLPSLENGMILWSTIYLFNPGTRKDTYSNYLTIPHMGQSGSHLAMVVNECMKTWISTSPKMDAGHSIVFSRDIIPLKDLLFNALADNSIAISIFDTIRISLRIGKASKELKSLLTGEFDELFLRFSTFIDLSISVKHGSQDQDSIYVIAEFESDLTKESTTFSQRMMRSAS